MEETVADKKIIPVFLASDENYAPFLAVVMYSILLNTESFVEFYILDGGICEKSKEKIEKSTSKFQNKKITYFNMQEFGLEKFPNLSHYSVNTFSRYFIPKLTPNLSKAIYLDVDTILTGDISMLFNESIDEYPLAAVPEDFYKKNGEFLKENIYQQYQNPDDYFNAGVLLLDVQKLIENNFSNGLINLTMQYSDKLNCADQDIFNIVFEGKYKKLDHKYNYIPDFCINYGKVSPLIIHYAGKKPWKVLDAPMSKEFFNTANKTAFALKIRNILIKNLLIQNIKQLKSFLYRNIKLPLVKLFFCKAK